MKTTQKYLNEIKMNVIDIELRSKEEIKQKVIIWETGTMSYEHQRLKLKAHYYYTETLKTKFKKKTFMITDHHQQYCTKQDYH